MREFFQGSLKLHEPLCLLCLSCCCPNGDDEQTNAWHETPGQFPQAFPSHPCPLQRFPVHCHSSSGALTRLIRTRSNSSFPSQGCSLNANQALAWMLQPGHMVLGTNPCLARSLPPKSFLRFTIFITIVPFKRKSYSCFVHDVKDMSINLLST